MTKIKELKTYYIEVVATIEVSASFEIKALSESKAKAEAEDLFEGNFDCTISDTLDCSNDAQDISFDFREIESTLVDSE